MPNNATVTTTPQDILTWAYGTSIENVPGAIATESEELLGVVIRAMRALYTVAARVNPTFFGEKDTVASDDNGFWRRPFGAESVFRIERASDNKQVVVVDLEDRQAEKAKPAVYAFGQFYRSAGNANDPGAMNLTFYFSKRPRDPAGLEDTLDDTWPEQFNNLLVMVVGLYLAEKDGRAAEVPGFLRAIEQESARFVQFLEHETVGIVRRHSHIKRFNTQTLVPIMSILTGRNGAGSAPAAG